MASADAGGDRDGMTAFTSAISSSAPISIDWQALRRLFGAALVAAMGAIAFSIAVGGSVVGSMDGLPPAAAADASALTGSVPGFIAVGMLHLVVAVALAHGGAVIRLAAVALTGLTAVVAATAAVMTAAGIDPFAGAGSGHPAQNGVAILVIAAAIYGAAASAVGIGSAETD